MAQTDITGIVTQHLVKPLHNKVVSSRRLERLARAAARLIPADQSLSGLDVGCGSGGVARAVMDLCPLVTIVGVEVMVREGTPIPVSLFDGKTLPFADDSFDFVMLVDVLHHTEEQLALLRECRRVARQFLIIKDHYCETAWDRSILSLMDWFGNRAYSVALPYNYLSQQSWQTLFAQSGLVCQEEITALGLYPSPASLIFERRLHFMSRLVRS